MREHWIQTGGTPAYSSVAKWLHWLTVALVAGLVPVGLLMTYRGNTLDIWDPLTNNLYSAHKLTGLLLLMLVLLRLGYRFAKGAPPDEPTLSPVQRLVAHITHWLLYALLLAVPLAGWIGVSFYPSLGVFDAISLPALTAPDRDAAGKALTVHRLLVFVLVGLICAHIGAALFHHFIRKDGVLRRMLPLKRPDQAAGTAHKSR